MPTMTAPPTVNIDQLCNNLSEQQLGLLASKVIRRLTDEFGVSLPFTLHDENKKPVGTVLAFTQFISKEEEESEFIQEALRRAANPSPVLLTPEEFLAAIPRK